MAFHAAGGTWLTRYRYRNGVRILMYHRFPQTHALEEQCIHLTRYYRPVSMSQVGSWADNGEEIPANAIVVTVDDGYRDFYTEAFPVLSRYSIPAIVYLATDMLDQRSCLWVDWVRVLFQSAGKGADAAFQEKERLKRLPNEERLARLERLPGELGISPAPDLPKDLEPLHWGEVREMSGKGIEFGAHTMSHPILARLESREKLKNELAGSKARIEAETGAPVRHFCYPNGLAADFTQETLSVLAECGYQTSVVGEMGINYPGANPYLLRRIGMEPDFRGLKFAQKAAGIGWG